MPDFTFAEHDYEVMMARRRAEALEALILLHKQNRDDEMFWHLTAEQRRRIVARFSEETLERACRRYEMEFA